MVIAAYTPTTTSPPLALPKGFFRLQTSPIAGFQYRGKDKWLFQMNLGDDLELVAEPANPYDKYAVRVHWQEKHIGYLPRKSNHIVSRLLRQGAPLTATIAWLNIEPDQHSPLTFHVFLPETKQAKKPIKKK